MDRLTALALAVGLIVIGTAMPAHAEAQCFDIAVVGRIVDQRNFVSLDEIDPNNGTVYIGGRWDLRIRVGSVLVGQELPDDIWLRVIMTDLPNRQSDLLFFLKGGTAEPYIATYWSFASRNEQGRFVLPADPSQPAQCP